MFPKFSEAISKSSLLQTCPADLWYLPVLFYFYDSRFLFLPRHQVNARIRSFCRLGNCEQVLKGLCKPLLLRGHRRVCGVTEKSNGQLRGHDRDTNALREGVQTGYTEFPTLMSI